VDGEAGKKISIWVHQEESCKNFRPKGEILEDSYLCVSEAWDDALLLPKTLGAQCGSGAKISIENSYNRGSRHEMSTLGKRLYLRRVANWALCGRGQLWAITRHQNNKNQLWTDDFRE